MHRLATIPSGARRRVVRVRCHAFGDYLPDRLQASGGVGLTESRLAQTVIIECRDQTLPDLEVNLNRADCSLLKAFDQVLIRRVRVNQERRGRPGNGLRILAEEPFHVVAALADVDRAVMNSDSEALVINGAADRSDNVDSFGLPEVLVDSALFVGIGVKRNAPLLLEHRGVVLAGIKPQPTEITFHG